MHLWMDVGVSCCRLEVSTLLPIDIKGKPEICAGGRPTLISAIYHFVHIILDRKKLCGTIIPGYYLIVYHP